MEYGLWLSAAGMQVNEYRQALTTNNLANVDTVGFKHDLAVIQERRVESRTDPLGAAYGDRLLDNLTGGPWVRPTYHSFEQGPLNHTGNSLDVAIEGDGLFTVRDGADVRYTRDGRMSINDKGELVSVVGEGRIRFLDEAGSPIVVNRGRPVTIGSDGVVRQGDARVARLGVVDVDDTNQLRKVGKNLFLADGATSRPSGSALRAGFVEGSTMSPVDGLAGMIEVSRAYEMNARMLSLQDSLIGQAVSRVGRLS